MKNITIYSKNNPMSREYFSRIYEIMEYSFPKNERRDFDEQFGELKKPQFRSMVFEENGRIAGFMNYWELSEQVYLEHFAVARELRGNGLGSKLVRELNSRIGNRPVILEAEPPELNETAMHRINFYKRLGFFQNDYEYYQPPYRAGEEAVRLIILSSPEALSPEEFLAARNALYREAYETDGNF